MLAAQVGHHADGRTTYGHSLIVNPWGEVVVDLGEKCDQVTVDINMEQVTSVRYQIRSLKNEREYSMVDLSS